MAALSDAFRAHVETGQTTLCRCWLITRSDGVTHGFTDHDQPLSFGAVTFQSDTGLTASTLAQNSGLSVDNTEAMGVLSDASVTERDIEAGRFDGAEVQAWLVNWADVSVRHLQFRGTIGELRRGNGAFYAELRGLTEALNRPLGRVYQKPCTAVLGDATCRFDTSRPGCSTDIAVETVKDARVFTWAALPGFEPGWFSRGRLSILSGAAAGLWAPIKQESFVDGQRRVELWAPVPATVAVGDLVQLLVGCDKRMDTCRFKFDNLLNFQGFPDIPSDDWIMAYPKSSNANTGGSLR